MEGESGSGLSPNPGKSRQGFNQVDQWASHMKTSLKESSWNIG